MMYDGTPIRVIILTCISCSLSLLALLLRFYARKKIKAKYGTDDWLAIVVLILLYAWFGVYLFCEYRLSAHWHYRGLSWFRHAQAKEMRLLTILLTIRQHAWYHLRRCDDHRNRSWLSAHRVRALIYSLFWPLPRSLPQNSASFFSIVEYFIMIGDSG